MKGRPALLSAGLHVVVLAGFAGLAAGIQGAPPSAPAVIEVSLLAPAPEPVAKPKPVAQAVEKAAPAEPEASPPAKPEITPIAPRPAAPAVRSAPARRVRPSARSASPAVSAAPAAVTPQPGQAAAIPIPAPVADTPPRVLARSEPDYPPAARRMGRQGTVRIRVNVAADGGAQARIIAGSGHDGLDQAALRAVSRWRFSPATQAGRPVAAVLDVPVVFRLD